MKRIIVGSLLAFMLAVPVFAEPLAIVKELTGKVEVKPLLGDWEAATLGMEMPQGASISTGFGSHALLELGDSSLLVKPLTRMKLEELLQQGDLQKTSLYLRVGRVKATVKTAEGLKQEFKVKSPLSTASVRGTEFSFDGMSLVVDSGLVMLSNPLSHSVSVGASEASVTRGYDKPEAAKEAKASKSKVTPAAAGPKKVEEKAKGKGKGSEKKSDWGSGGGKKEPAVLTGTIEIRWK